MSDKAQERIDAIGKQLLPPITKVAPGSSAPRVQNKVVIITGNPNTRSSLPRLTGGLDDC